MAKKKVIVSDGAKEVLEVLKSNGGEMTFAQIKEVMPNANVSHLGVLTRENYATKDRKIITEVITRTAEKTVYKFEKDVEKE